ncbi:neuropeptide F receptor-like protein, partial [Leptotrombidium deliense]
MNVDLSDLQSVTKFMDEEVQLLTIDGNVFIEGTMEFGNHNYTNMSSAEIYEALYLNYTLMKKKLETLMTNKALNDATLIWLLIAYTVLIVLGATGNGLVCMAVARKPQMRTPRNVFIINLAISDLILCLFTMPFSLVEITLKFWPLGQITCKLVAGLEATSIFVSTISITAIALDRYKVIVKPSPEPCHPLQTLITLSSIWATAF